MPGKNDKSDFETVINGLKAIKHALKNCASQEEFHSLITSYSSIDVHKMEVQRYIKDKDHKKQRSDLIDLESKITNLITANRHLYGITQQEPEVIVRKSTLTEPTDSKVTPTTTDTPKTTTTDAPKTATTDTPKTATTDTPKTATTDAPKTATTDAPKTATTDAPKTATTDAPKTATTDAPKTTTTGTPKTTTTEIPNKTTTEAPKAPAEEVTKEQAAAKIEQMKNLRERQLSQFTKMLKQLVAKRDNFHARYPTDSSEDTSKAYGASFQLVKKLEQSAESYKNGLSDLNQFKKDSSQAIRDKRHGVLNQHRGFKEIIANLLLAIGTLGIGYVIAALFTQRFTPIRLNTDSINKLDETQETIDVLKAGV